MNTAAPRQNMKVTVRRAQAADVRPLLALMLELAEFEGYRERFRVTEQDLLDRGLNEHGPAQFVALIAEREGGDIVGYAVVYEVPFTYDLRPTLVLKELYVRADLRGLSIGESLMTAVIAHAKARGCARLKWEVLPDNDGAKRFYRRCGGTRDEQWENWILMIADGG